MKSNKDKIIINSFGDLKKVFQFREGFFENNAPRKDAEPGIGKNSAVVNGNRVNFDYLPKNNTTHTKGILKP